MALILGLETSGDVCSVALLQNAEVMFAIEKNEKNIHAALLTSLIEECLIKTETPIKSINAVAVSMGPGSYTGLRVGVSSAKGLCYALKIPLIAVSTLELMMRGYVAKHNSFSIVCPMIDARRMEVYSAVFGPDSEWLAPPQAQILNENSYNSWHNSPIAFIGNGAAKMRTFEHHFNHATFSPDFSPKAEFIAVPAYHKWMKKEFENTASFEPFYLKDFFTPLKA